ncbi:hypothetical protein M1437_02855 [Patescibacteria group bacterium]|nr:hypothetical protein [Patescibacteria group bacterium]
MNTTQKHLSIADIYEDILLLKDGGGALVLQVSAVNFGLLSEREQMSIIYAFAQMLNSLSFSIQIVITSQRLNIGSYLLLLDKAQKAQSNPLLSQMITEYKQFIQSTIKENEVLDKQFYIVIPLFSIELGLSTQQTVLKQKIKTILLPRRDQVIRQMGRIGLKAVQLSRQKLIEVFYDIYNGQMIEKPAGQSLNPESLAVKLKNPQPIQKDSERLRMPESQNVKASDNPDIRSSGTSGIPGSPISANTPTQPPIITQNSRSHPFVVEELEE